MCFSTGVFLKIGIFRDLIWCKDPDNLDDKVIDHSTRLEMDIVDHIVYS